MLRSKALVSAEELGNQYVLLGPYKEHCARTEVEDLEFPVDSPLHKAVTVMRNKGNKVRFHYIPLIILLKNIFIAKNVTFLFNSFTLELG